VAVSDDWTLLGLVALKMGGCCGKRPAVGHVFSSAQPPIHIILLHPVSGLFMCLRVVRIKVDVMSVRFALGQFLVPPYKSLFEGSGPLIPLNEARGLRPS
jgi:hypothetical protein